jgi:hypothetical protein
MHSSNHVLKTNHSLQEDLLLLMITESVTMASNTRILVSNQTVTAPAMDYWFGIGLGVKTIADLKALLAANEGLSPQEVHLFLKNGFLRDETNVSILREEDVVSIKRKTRLDTNCSHQLVITSMSV